MCKLCSNKEVLKSSHGTLTDTWYGKKNENKIQAPIELTSRKNQRDPRRYIVTISMICSVNYCMSELHNQIIGSLENSGPAENNKKKNRKNWSIRKICQLKRSECYLIKILQKFYELYLQIRPFPSHSSQHTGQTCKQHTWTQLNKTHADWKSIWIIQNVYLSFPPKKPILPLAST